MNRSNNPLLAVISLVVLGASIYGIFHRQAIYDWAVLRSYNPPQQVVRLADETTMKDQTRKVFYVNKPALQDKQSFKQSCDANEQSIVLGCYVTHRGIYLLNVDDQRLSGVVEVTAAHETLHAEYDRLSAAKRQEVDQMTATFFASLNNERIKKTIENYRKKDPSVVPNELHSILGTEVRDLPPELESYYSQYFTDRKAIVAFSEKYEQTFVDLKNQVDQYDSQLANLKKNIEASQAAIEALSRTINSEKQRLDSLLSKGKTEEYNASVPGFNAQVGQYNGLINTTRAQIDQYNQIVERRNAVAATEDELVQSIDANSLPKKQ